MLVVLKVETAPVVPGPWITPSSFALPGFQGLQFYPLHRKEIPNYRLRCLQWLRRQPRWSSWGWNQISCPCSWQQGRWDLRFQPRGDTSFLSLEGITINPYNTPHHSSGHTRPSGHSQPLLRNIPALFLTPSIPRHPVPQCVWSFHRLTGLPKQTAV